MVFPLEVKQAGMEADKLGLKLRVGFQDEAKFGRISIPRKCWSPRGHRPIVGRQIVREYTYAYGLTFPDNGELDSYILPRMNTPIMEIFLKRISKRHPNEYVLMVMDGASCHTAKNLKVPKNGLSIISVDHLYRILDPLFLIPSNKPYFFAFNLATTYIYNNNIKYRKRLA